MFLPIKIDENQLVMDFFLLNITSILSIIAIFIVLLIRITIMKVEY